MMIPAKPQLQTAFVLAFAAHVVVILISAVTLGQDPTAANTNANVSPSPTATATPSPTPIPISGIVTQLEETAKRLKEIKKKLSDESPVVQIQKDLAALKKDIDAHEARLAKILKTLPSLQTLDNVESDWKELLLRSRSWNRAIENYLEEIDKRGKELKTLILTWLELVDTKDKADDPAADEPEKETKKVPEKEKPETTGKTDDELLRDDQKQQVPEEFNLKIQATIAEIGKTRKWLGELRTEQLTLQSRVVEQENRIEEARKTIKGKRDAALSKLIVRDSPWIWNLRAHSGYSGEDIGKSFTSQLLSLNEYFTQYWPRPLFHILLILLLYLTLFGSRRSTRRLVEQEPGLKRALAVFEVPMASALLLTLFLGRFLYPQPPDLLRSTFLLAFLATGFILIRRLVESTSIPVLGGLVVLAFVDELKLVTSSLQLINRTIFLAQMLGAAVIVYWLIRPKRLAARAKESITKIDSIIRFFGIILILVFATSFVANALGYVSLSRIIGNGILRSGYIAMLLYAVVQVAESLAVFLFWVGPISRLNMVGAKRDLIQKKIFSLFSWIAIATWFYLTLVAFYINDRVIDFVVNLVTAKLTVRNFSIALIDIIGFFFLIWLAFAISAILRFILEEDVYPRLNLEDGVPYTISTILHYILLLFGFVLAISALGFDLTKFTLLAGAFGVGLGFGLRNVVNNFVSGIILLFERPVKIGDFVETGENQGYLRTIGLRASILRTLDGAEVVVPNGNLLSEEFINWTLSDSMRRLRVTVGVEYGSDPEKIIKILENAAIGLPGLDKDPQPQILFLGFGDNSLDFEVRAWTRKRKGWLGLKSDLTVAINKALTEAGVEIPVPQRDLHLKTVDPSASEAVKSVQKKSDDDDKKD